MSPNPLPQSQAPDREFARAAGITLAVWLGLAILSAMGLDMLHRREVRIADAALAGSEQLAAAHDLSASLARAASLAPGPERRAAEIAVGWAAERVGAIETRLAAGAAPGDGAPEVGAAAEIIAAAAEAAQKARAGFDPASLDATKALVGAQLMPRVERAAQARAAAAEGAIDRICIALGLALALQFAGAAAVVAAVGRPAKARIAAWARDRQETEQENRFRLLHDPLTQMPNATYLQAYLERLAAGAERATAQTAVLRLDLDRFKNLRETLGPRAADEIIRITARRLRHVLRAGDFAAHLGQDDFVLIAPDLADANDAAAIAQRVQQAVTKPVSLQGGARRVGCSIGVTMLGDDLPEAERVLANAEIALGEAQAAGSGGIGWFRESLRAEAERRELLHLELVRGLERGEIAPYFQPQIDLPTGSLAGFEALVRWRHPAKGLLTPSSFLDFAEAAELTERIGEVVLAQSLAALTAWDAAGLEVPKVGINFALAQLRDPRLIEKIKWEAERSDVDPGRIAIEVLETVLIKSDADIVVRNIRGLASAGFRIDLDDFGTGHASIQNLRRFMVDRIKIDRSFVFGIESSEEQQKLTASMVAMARALGIRTLAEGVETAEAAAVLRDLGCDCAQGYLVAKPMSQADTFAWLRSFMASGGLWTRPERAAARDPNMP